MIKINETFQYNDTSKIKYLYHSVFSKKSYEYVLKNGITHDVQGWVYLSEKPMIINGGNHSWALNTVAVFKVKIPDNRKLYDWREIWYDKNDKEYDSDHQYEKSNPYYMYSGNIPKQYIQEVTKYHKE